MLKSLLVVGALALLGAPVAEASTSTNWSGYVAHSARFQRVTALWTQPTSACTPGTPTYSAAWVGLGGYSLSSKALEQIGTEADCSTSGQEVSSAWYELVPAPSREVRMSINPGDVMAGRVTVVGNQVTVTLTDRTQHTSFTKTVTDHTLDVTSADWILEAPSQCGGNGFRCTPLALADFGSERFAQATAETASGRSGAISSKLWRMEMITLSPAGGGRTFARNGAVSQGVSSPSALTNAGTAFSLTYSPFTPAPSPTPTPTPTPTQSSYVAVTSAAALHPGGARR